MTLAATVKQAEAYFIPDQPLFWCWAESGCREINGCWDPPNLIVFREELAQLLAELQPQGWPPLSALLMLCAALRENWPQTRTSLQTKLINGKPTRTVFVNELLQGLERVHLLPRSLRESMRAKAEIARMVFEGGRPARSPQDAETALQYLAAVVPFRSLDSWTPVNSADESSIATQTRSLRVGLSRISRAAVEARLQTGLEQELQPADVSIPPDAPTHSARLVQWTTDRDLYAVARIARQLVSILSWPRTISEPEDLSLGGVSDITNTGPLDRLLLSELAHDDETLSVRIALKEALYIRRESPRQPVARRRSVLVDTSLRLWGTPRVFGAAVALALAAGEDDDPALSVTVDVTDEASWKSVNLKTRSGATELLSCLTPSLHAASAIVAWSQHGIPDDLPCDPVLITSAETLAEPHVQLALGSLPVDYYVALVSRHGNFELRQHSAQGWRTIRRAELNLDELLQPPVQTRPLAMLRRDPDRFPALLRIEPFPLRLPHQFEAGHTCLLGGDWALSQASGNRLMHWESPQKGPRQLSLKFPAGKIEACRSNTLTVFSPDHTQVRYVRGAVAYLALRGSSWQLARIEWATGKVDVLALATKHSSADQGVRAVFLDQCLVLLGRQSLQAFSLDTGEMLKERHFSFAPFEYAGTQYFKNRQGVWHQLTFDGQLDFQQVDAHSQSQLLIDPDRAGHGPGKPWCLTCVRGHAIGQQTAPKYQENKIEWAAQHGPLVMLHGTFHELGGYRFANPVTGVWNIGDSNWIWKWDYNADIANVIRNQALQMFRPRQNLRHKFQQLDVSAGRICLKSAKQWWELRLHQDRLKLMAVPTLADHAGQATFEKHSWPNLQVQFRSAALPNGNSVWLDSRGLLHLLPANVHEPELTLILDEEQVSGWISTGATFGDAYYFDEQPASIPLQRAWEENILPFFTNLR